MSGEVWVTIAGMALEPAHPPLWGAVVVLVLAGLRVNLLVAVTAAVAAVAALRALGG